MYRLRVVAGPNRGASYQIGEGESSIGRSDNNTVVLSSSQVSKRHCVLIARDGEIVVQDQGSSNGTFVNGVLTRSRKLQSGDKISVGEFVLELMPFLPKKTHVPLDLPGSRPMTAGGNVFQLPVGVTGVSQHHPQAAQPAAELQKAPTDLKSKGLWYFDNYVMSFFYGLNLRYEWRTIAAAGFVVFLLLNLFVSVQPLLQANTEDILKETARRADFIAREIAEQNTKPIAAGAETKTEIGIASKAAGVETALITDLDQRIIAPAEKMNQYMVSGAESRFANRMSHQFRGGRETGATTVVDGTTVVAVEPIKIYDPRLGRNSTVAMSVVAIDGSIATMGMGEVGVIYSETLILTGLIGGLFLLIMYRLTLKPFQILNEDMDKGLKGDITQVTHEFRFEELNSLWDLINSALQRIPRASGGGGFGSGGAPEEAKPEVFLGSLRASAEASGMGMIFCGPDRKIIAMNSMFEELSGIRADGSTGEEIGSVARDQSLGALAQDLFDRAVPGGEAVIEDYEFSGISCKVHAIACGGSGEPAKAFALLVKKSE